MSFSSQTVKKNPKKQGLLPVHMFVNAPSKQFVKKHNKLVNKLHPKKKIWKQSKWLTKSIKARQDKEKEIAIGAEGWRKWLQAHDNQTGMDPKMLFLISGNAPPIGQDLDTSEDDDSLASTDKYDDEDEKEKPTGEVDRKLGAKSFLDFDEDNCDPGVDPFLSPSSKESGHSNLNHNDCNDSFHYLKKLSVCHFDAVGGKALMKRRTGKGNTSTDDVESDTDEENEF